MVNGPKYNSDNPRVLISTRLKTKQRLQALHPDKNTLHKKLVKLIDDIEEG